MKRCRLKRCRDCSDAELFSTGSTIFYLCRKTGRMRLYDDVCACVLAHQKGSLNDVETESFVDGLFEAGKIAYDPDGWLEWLK